MRVVLTSVRLTYFLLVRYVKCADRCLVFVRIIFRRLIGCSFPVQLVSRPIHPVAAEQQHQ